MTHIDVQTYPTRAWVAFSGQTDLPWLRILKKKFRHCFVVLHDGRQWITVDPMAHRTDICVHPLSPDFDLPQWLEKRGLKVIPARLDEKRREAPWGLFTCVEAVKRVLGIHNRFIVTPWQLHQHLVRAARMPQSVRKPLHRISTPTSSVFPQPQGDLAWEV